eukprot:Tamp_08348.p1 GENE.Tamp_08348~~Tamp_08348.p1  ORF type:complete len:661 (+),score=103.28 Tamp_08348:141-2123(+)
MPARDLAFDERLRPKKYRVRPQVNEMPPGGQKGRAPAGWWGMEEKECWINVIPPSTSVNPAEDTRVASDGVRQQLDAARIEIRLLGPREVENLRAIAQLAHTKAREDHALENQKERTVIPLRYWFAAACALGFPDFAKLCMVGWTEWEAADGSKFWIRNHPHAVCMTHGQRCGAHCDILSGKKKKGLATVMESSALFDNMKYIIKLNGDSEHECVVFGATANCGTERSLRLFKVGGGCVVVGTECALAETVHGAVQCEECLSTTLSQLVKWQNELADPLTPCQFSFMFNVQGGEPASVVKILRTALSFPVPVSPFDFDSVPHAIVSQDVGSNEFKLCKRALSSRAPVVYWGGSATATLHAQQGSPKQLAGVPFMLAKRGDKWGVDLEALHGTYHPLGERLGLVARTVPKLPRESEVTCYGDPTLRSKIGRSWWFKVDGQLRILHDYICPCGGRNRDEFVNVAQASTSSPASPALPSVQSSAVPADDVSAGAGAREEASSAGTKRQGENVKGNPQRTAREGQKHWHEKCQVLRAEAEAAQTSAERPEFHAQRQMCAARNFKCQKESLLLFLQRATQQQLISPLPFVHADDEGASFVGWTGFRVEPGCGEQFRAGVEGLFPETPKLNTLYHLFRRSGLVPEDWRRAWEGEIPFLWNPNRVSA